MALIKNGVFADDPWTVVGEEDPVPGEGPVIVSVERWQAERETLIGRNEPLGIRLRSDQSPALIEADLDRFEVIAIEFPAFKDGRGFSYGRLLRERLGYEGEIRAFGHVIRDQFLFLARCGFDAVDVGARYDADDWAEALAEQSVFYQATGDGRETVQEKRGG